MEKKRQFDGTLAVPIWRLGPDAELMAALLGESKDEAALRRAAEIAGRLPELREYFNVSDGDPNWLLLLIARMGAEIGIPAFRAPKKKGRKPTRRQSKAVQARWELFNSIENWVTSENLVNAGKIWTALDSQTPSIRKKARARIPVHYRNTPMQTIRSDYNAAKKERASVSRPSHVAPTLLSGGLSGGLFGLGLASTTGLLGDGSLDEKKRA